MFAFISFIVFVLLTKTANTQNFGNILKCCENKFILNENFGCIRDSANITNNGTLLEEIFKVGQENRTIFNFCIFTNGTEDYQRNQTCMDIMANGTEVRLTCDQLSANATIKECSNIFSVLSFWGATTVIFATMIYNVPFILVVIIYCALPTLRARAYDKAVISYNLCYMVINFLLIILGFLSLCHEILPVVAYRCFGLALMFFTQGSVLWLFIICFDMTLCITRFRWAPKSGADRGREEKRKFIIYAAWGWGVPAVLTLNAAIAEFSPMYPEDSSLRPNFHNFNSPNIAVIVYVITGPVVVCFINTCLFIYTTAKTIAVQRSTAIINENRKTNVKKKYILFMKLYLLMDTPWFTSALAAIYPDLWILKFIKMVQPMILLFLILPRKRILAAMHCYKHDNDEEAARLKDEPRKKNNIPVTKKIVKAGKC